VVRLNYDYLTDGQQIPDQTLLDPQFGVQDGIAAENGVSLYRAPRHGFSGRHVEFYTADACLGPRTTRSGQSSQRGLYEESTARRVVIQGSGICYQLQDEFAWDDSATRGDEVG